MSSAEAAGRNCPTAYRYSPAVFRREAEIEADTLYVVGGLYGNPFALDAMFALAEREPVAPSIIFNGDFNWFDIDPAGFAALNARVLEHNALRGNVETELAGDDEAAGCGCGYPEWVGDPEVERSNAVIRRLRDTARSFPELRTRLGALPMHSVASVGGVRIAVVHGDAWSLAGWGFSQERLREDASAAAVAFEKADVRVFACSHTCLPVFQSLDLAHGRSLIANNGAAGMPNFRDTRFGLLTRISVRSGAGALYGERVGHVWIQAIPIHYDHERWLAHFDALWPVGSPAAVSYRKRITSGPSYKPVQAVRAVVRGVEEARPRAVPVSALQRGLS
jgi:hypothetical protein